MSRLAPLRRRIKTLLVLSSSLLAQPASATLEMLFRGTEDQNVVYWHFSGCVQIFTPTEFGPLNDESWLYPKGVGWAFFTDDGTGTDIVKKGTGTTMSNNSQFRWIIKDSVGNVVETIEVPIVGWLILKSTQAIEPRTAPYTVPNLEAGQKLCLEGSGSFELNDDSINNSPNTLSTVFRTGLRYRATNGGELVQTMIIYPEKEGRANYASYRENSFGNQAGGERGDPTSDFDRDGSSNLLEYATATDASKAGPQGVSMHREGDKVCIEFKMRTDDPSLNYELEYGSSLGGLSLGEEQSAQLIWTGTILRIGGEDVPLELVRFSTTEPGIRLVRICYTGKEPFFFMRLRVTRSP